MDWHEYQLTIQLFEPLLGTIPKDEDVWSQHVLAEEHQDHDDENPPVVAEEDRTPGWTGFYTDDDGRPVLMDYQFKGFLKEAANIIKEDLGITALRKKVDDDLFVFPRRTVLADEPDGVLERPLRAMTRQGPRVTVVRSDTIEPGRQYTFRLKVRGKSKVTEEILREILAYGELKGLGQWRNGSFGRFTSVLTPVPAE